MRLTTLTILGLAWAAVQADDDVTSKTVLGPSNIFLYEGANKLKTGDAKDGVRLTLQGLKTAANAREEKIGHANLCAGFLMMSQFETALEHCDWVIARDPNHWRTYNNRAIVYLRLGRFEESEADIRRGQELNPRSENLKEVKGMYLDQVEPVREHITIDDRRGSTAPDARDEN
ncbi:MAG TPA: tetratricopeptide repeat protein [Woeseiaceae bacterium]|nr:tetratricopeptide repeat protein [Woeseiaceae bacterium]